jgi:uncharacterized protein YgiM (DUF1202 family)
MKPFMTKTALILASAALMASGAPLAASAQTGAGPGSIVNCDASGNKQAAGALLGAVAGAAIGNNVSKSHSAPLVGGVVGAATGSYVGCQQQRNRAARHAANSSGRMAAVSSVNVRSAPSTRAAKVGSLAPGQRFQAMGRTGNWIAVGYNGHVTGYVNASYVTPA